MRNEELQHRWRSSLRRRWQHEHQHSQTVARPPGRPFGSGKSSFARKHFLSTEVISSDFCRALVADNENDQSATGDAFDLLHRIVRKRLARGRLTLVDATNVQPEARKSLIALARSFISSLKPLSSISRNTSVRINVLRPDRQSILLSPLACCCESSARSKR